MFVRMMKFIGTDGSMGYKNGEVYSLLIVQGYFGHAIVIEPIGQPKMRCPYSNMNTFLNNWSNI